MTHLHSRQCLGAAIIAAVENVRDEEGQTDHRFRIEAQDNYFLHLADGYLADQTMTCRCGAWVMDDVMTVLDREGATAATELAAQYLADGRLTTGQYIGLVRESEGRDASAWSE